MRIQDLRASRNVCLKIYKKIRVLVKRYEFWMLLALTVGIILGLLISPVFASEPERVEMLGQKYEQYIRARPATTTTTTVPKPLADPSVNEAPNSSEAPLSNTQNNSRPSGGWVSQCKIWMQGIIPEEEQEAALFIIQRESKCDYLAKNPRSSATGICQTLVKTHNIEADFFSNPLTQMRWCHQYAIGRYGSWGNAKNFWIKNHWW